MWATSIFGAIQKSAPTQFSDVDELGESRPGIEIRLRDDSDEHRELPQEQSRRRSRQGNGVHHFGRLTFICCYTKKVQD